MAFEGIIPAVTTPFTADDQVDVAALKANVEALIEAGVHGFVATGTMGEAGSLTARGARARSSAPWSRPPTAACRSPSACPPARPRSRSSTRSTPRPRARRDHVAAAARLPRRPRRGRSRSSPSSRPCGLPMMAYNNPEASGVDMPPELIVRIYEEVDGVVAIKECSGDARRIPALLQRRRRPRGAGRRRRLGARGLRAPARPAGSPASASSRRARSSSSTTPCKAGELAAARDVYRRMLPIARFDMTPKLVQYFKAAQDAVGFNGGPTRAPRLPLKADRARGARGRARDPARAGARRESARRYFAAVDSHTEGMPTRVVTGGVGPIPGATMLERKLHFEAAHGRPAAAADARAARPRRDVGGDPAAPDARRRRLGRALHRGQRAAADVRARDDRRRHRAGGDRAWSR